MKPVYARRSDMKKLIVRGDGQAGSDEQNPHWLCPHCGIPCFCTGDARLMPHTSCGRPGAS